MVRVVFSYRDSRTIVLKAPVIFLFIENKPNQPNSANIYQTFYQRESYKSNIKFSINKKMTGAFSLVFFLNYTALILD
jgi:hypothetical protein